MVLRNRKFKVLKTKAVELFAHLLKDDTYFLACIQFKLRYVKDDFLVNGGVVTDLLELKMHKQIFDKNRIKDTNFEN